MGGDLNLKKSWHPSLMSNQKKVWEEEQKALEERKKIEQIRKERDEERQLQELQDLQEAAGGKKRQTRVDWMYSGPSSGQTGTTEETEAFLLGKRRVDTLLQGKEKESLQKAASQDAFIAVQNANTARDTALKVRDDPLLAIKKQEQAAYEAMMSDPIKRRMLLRAAGKDEEPEPERKRRKHHHHSSRHKDRDEDSRSRHRSSRHESDHHERSRWRRRVSRSHSPSRSPTSEQRSRRRSSPRSSRRSPPGDSRHRSRSPYRERNSDHTLHKARSWHNSRQKSRSRSRSPQQRRSSPKEDDSRAAKLAAMQQDATDLDVQRQRRLQEIAEREQRTAAQENKARAQNARHGGGRADFVNGFHKRAGDMSLSERVGRQRHSRRDDE
ncbi:RNA-splicing factor [Knufia obscura]|uniref:RNA-splicing factor n=2 Tax=Knufia TaxID=430999 RepID=A0AAN8IQH3_9EURO|nr:RNA-splicing factor [Knufia obscura]KAK5956062.1 RNA-splicing factor [Knufia fluminis]